jgi:hypothetical protein
MDRNLSFSSLAIMITEEFLQDYVSRIKKYRVHLQNTLK